MPVAGPIPSAPGSRALVVDDEPHIVDRFKATLEETRFNGLKRECGIHTALDPTTAGENI